MTTKAEYIQPINTKEVKAPFIADHQSVGTNWASRSDSSHLPVRDRSGRTIERRSTDSSGNTTVRDRSGSMKYRIDKDGTIRDRSGSRLGKIDKR